MTRDANGNACQPQPGEVWLVTMPWWAPGETATAVFTQRRITDSFGRPTTFHGFVGHRAPLFDAIPIRKLGHDCNA